MQLRAVLLLFVLFAIAPMGFAGNIVLNPSFDDAIGALPDWTASIWYPSGNAVTGAQGAYTACYGLSNWTVDCYLRQDLATTVGEMYDLSFWAQGVGFIDNELVVVWNGTTVVFDLMNLTEGYVQYSASGLVSTSTTTRLEFLGRAWPGNLNLDDVSVSETVPEPSAALLMLCGLALVGARGRGYIKKANRCP